MLFVFRIVRVSFEVLEVPWRKLGWPSNRDLGLIFISLMSILPEAGHAQCNSCPNDARCGGTAACAFFFDGIGFANGRPYGVCYYYDADLLQCPGASATVTYTNTHPGTELIVAYYYRNGTDYHWPKLRLGQSHTISHVHNHVTRVERKYYRQGDSRYLWAQLTWFCDAQQPNPPRFAAAEVNCTQEGIHLRVRNHIPDQVYEVKSTAYSGVNGGRPLRITASDTTGRLELPPLPPGQYTLRITAEALTTSMRGGGTVSCSSACTELSLIVR